MNDMKLKGIAKILEENGYGWSGLIAKNYGRRFEEYRKVNSRDRSIDDHYILLGFPYYWDEDTGRVSVIDNGAVKYIEQDDITLKVYNMKSNGELQLEKDLSNEWVKYQALNIDGYARQQMAYVIYIKHNYKKDIEGKKNLLAQEIERLTKETNKAIGNMEKAISRSQEIEEILNEVVEWEV